jgi:hypothetical protein
LIQVLLLFPEPIKKDPFKSYLTAEGSKVLASQGLKIKLNTRLAVNDIIYLTKYGGVGVYVHIKTISYYFNNSFKFSRILSLLFWYI